MKKFRDFLKEEIAPFAMSDGRIDVEDYSVRDQINGMLAAVCESPTVTPYNALHKIRKVLAFFHIDLPKRAYLEGSKGIEVWEVKQFGERMGMTNDGEFVKDVPAKWYVFFKYDLVSAHFHIRAKLVDKNELKKEVTAAESIMAEGQDAESQLNHSKMKALKEPMHKMGDEPKKKGNKVAFRTMEKKSVKEASDVKRGLEFDPSTEIPKNN